MWPFCGLLRQTHCTFGWPFIRCSTICGMMCWLSRDGLKPLSRSKQIFTKYRVSSIEFLPVVIRPSLGQSWSSWRKNYFKQELRLVGCGCGVAELGWLGVDYCMLTCKMLGCAIFWKTRVLLWCYGPRLRRFLAWISNIVAVSVNESKSLRCLL